MSRYRCARAHSMSVYAGARRLRYTAPVTSTSLEERAVVTCLRGSASNFDLDDVAPRTCASAFAEVLDPIQPHAAPWPQEMSYRAYQLRRASHLHGLPAGVVSREDIW